MALKRIHLKQLNLALSVIATIGLAAAVFLWGSEYKCSLYHKHPERHARIATAKLLSEQERPMAAEKTLSLRAPLPQAVFFALGVLLFGLFRITPMGRDQVLLGVRDESAADRTCCLIHFSFRPPPSTVV